MTHRERKLRVGAETQYDPDEMVPVSGGRFTDVEAGVRYETVFLLAADRDTRSVVHVLRRDQGGIYRWSGAVKVTRPAGATHMRAAEIVEQVGVELGKGQAA